MKYILLFFTLSCLSFSLPAYAKGHGGHGGGHSGGHSGSHGGSHSGIHAVGGHSNGNSHFSSSGIRHTTSRAAITRSTSPSTIAAHHARSMRPMTAQRANTAPMVGAAAGSRGGAGTANPPENYNSGYSGYYYNPYYSYYPYYYSPVFYDPYYSPFMFYYGFMYTPNYYPGSAPMYTNSDNNEQLSKEPMDGYVVFFNDTLSGAVTVDKRAISLETIDSGRNYDYRFHQKDQGLQYVTVYNEDDKQLNLVRLKEEPKKLLRVIHTGKLNIYDSRRGFIYKPADIDVKTLTVSYNGEVASLHSNSVNDTKEWLTQYVNQAYGLNLDPNKFNWTELLIYIDKLD